MGKTKKAVTLAESKAVDRFRMISPLLEASLDAAARKNLREKIAADNDISTRTIYRYEKAYQSSGFAGLKPVDRSGMGAGKLPENFDERLSQAILLKREVPKRSVSQIIRILELEGRVPEGVLRRSTLQDHLYAAGYGRRQMLQYTQARNSSSKRFCKPHRMMLVQGDIKYGPLLPIGKKGAKVKTYLSSVIDDHSRLILASKFYAGQDAVIVEDTLHTAITNYGRMDACYFDNGSQYVSRQLKLSLSRLGITIRHAPLQSGRSKGKIEKFHQVVDSFLMEAKLKNVTTLEELNRLWGVFLCEEYQKRPHDGIREYYESLGASVSAEGITPQQEFNRDTRPLVFLDTNVVSEAFLHHKKRLVDKGACISFRGKRYETKPSLIGATVEIAYDPMAPETVTVSYPGTGPFTVSPLKIGEFCDKNPTLPVSMQEAKPKTSRYLDAAAKKHEDSREHLADALSFASYGKEADDHV